MANKETGELTSATALTGQELVHVVQGGNSRKTTTAAIGGDLTSLLRTNIIMPTVNSTTLTVIGCAATVTGNGAEAIATTNAFTRQRRIAITVSAINTFSQIRETNASLLMQNGWTYFCRFGVKTNVTNGRLMVGVNGSWTGTQEISAATNIIVVGKDSADTNLQIMHNDGTGTATKVDLGSNFPANTSSTDYYDVEFDVAVGGASVTYRVTRLNTGHVATGTLSTDLPASSTLHTMGCWAGTGATSGQALNMMYLMSKLKTP